MTVATLAYMLLLPQRLRVLTLVMASLALLAPLLAWWSGLSGPLQFVDGSFPSERVNGDARPRGVGGGDRVAQGLCREVRASAGPKFGSSWPTQPGQSAKIFTQRAAAGRRQVGRAGLRLARVAAVNVPQIDRGFARWKQRGRQVVTRPAHRGAGYTGSRAALSFNRGTGCTRRSEP